MTIVEIEKGQQVTIPEIHLTDGKPMAGVVKATDGERLVIELASGRGVFLPHSLEQMCILKWEVQGIARACPFLIRSHNTTSIVGQVVIQERRQAPRLRVDMDLRYEYVPADQVKQAAEQVMTVVNRLDQDEAEIMKVIKTGEDPLAQIREEILSLREMMAELMGKVDDLTAIVSGRQPCKETFPGVPLCIQNCSSTGVGLVTGEEIKVGEYLRLQMTLRTAPQTVIDAMAVVVRSLPMEEAQPQGRWDIGLQFTHIHENDRERLIHYLFRLQRRMLRDLKEAREALNDRSS